MLINALGKSRVDRTGDESEGNFKQGNQEKLREGDNVLQR